MAGNRRIWNEWEEAGKKKFISIQLTKKLMMFFFSGLIKDSRIYFEHTHKKTRITKSPDDDWRQLDWNYKWNDNEFSMLTVDCYGSKNPLQNEMIECFIFPWNLLLIECKQTNKKKKNSSNRMCDWP